MKQGCSFKITSANLRSIDVGVDAWGNPVMPPLIFDDLWYALNVLKRAILFETMACDASVSAIKLGTALSRLDHDDGRTLVDLFVNCSIAQMIPYLQICSVDRGVPVQDQHSEQEAINDPDYECLSEWQEDMEVALRECWDADSVAESTSEALDSSSSSHEAADSEPTPSFETVFEPADPKLCQLIHNLPSELLLQIQGEFLDMSFGPRKVYPYHELLNSHVFKALNHQLLARYRRIFFRNTWVIGQGDRDEAVEFLDRMPRSVRHLVQNVEMTFTALDYSHIPLDSYFEEKTQDRRNALEMLYNYRTECSRIAWQLITIWFEKFYVIATLDLDYFVLDMRDTYAPDGEYLGVLTARRLIPFMHGLPAGFFTIWAPTPALADEIWDIFMLNNH